MSAAARGTRRRAAPIRVGSAAPVACGRGISALLGWVFFAALGWGVLVASSGGVVAAQQRPGGDRPPFPSAPWERGVVAEGLPVSPFFEGWYENPDGSYTLSFGFFNRNRQETVHIPHGPANYLSLEELGGVQPTLFPPAAAPASSRLPFPASSGRMAAVSSGPCRPVVSHLIRSPARLVSRRTGCTTLRWRWARCRPA